MIDMHMEGTLNTSSPTSMAGAVRATNLTAAPSEFNMSHDVASINLGNNDGYNPHVVPLCPPASPQP